jgi:hypothetical protein
VCLQDKLHLLCGPSVSKCLPGSSTHMRPCPWIGPLRPQSSWQGCCMFRLTLWHVWVYCGSTQLGYNTADSQDWQQQL